MTERQKSIPDTLGQRLRLLRQQRGLSQQDLVTADISASYISLIETNKRVPSDTVIEALAERLGTSVNYLRTGQDDNRVKEIELAIAFGDMALRRGADGEALQAYTEALGAIPLLDAATTRRARIGQALALERLGRLEAAIAQLSALFENPSLPVASSEWSRLATALCRCYRDSGDYVLSVELGERALGELDRLGLDATDDHRQLGSVLIDCYRIRGDLTRAHMLALRLIRDDEHPGSPVLRGGVYWNAALVARARNRTDEALTLAERALSLLAETDGARHQALLKELCGELLLDSDQVDAQRAKQLIEEAQGVLVAIGTTHDQARGEIGLAKAALRLGEPGRGEQHASRAIGLLSSQPPYQAAEAWTVLAEALFRKGEEQNAEDALRTAERQLGLLPPNRLAAEVWRRVGDLWQDHDHGREAITAYQQALAQAGIPAAPGRHQHHGRNPQQQSQEMYIRPAG
ncbi:helix-turn-helix domain-containing protein [Streptacidiphilus sp. EB129]|uniref:helix-turn-helix domain-containing protein n=1 Tax=Streptacidiphilus sp. EB129 TaxID=3156262 RepID=UPI0035119EDD